MAVESRRLSASLQLIRQVVRVVYGEKGESSEMVSAVLFDLDDTMLDRDASLLRFLHDQHDRLQPFLGHILQADYVKRFVELDAHGYVWKDVVYQKLIEEFRIQGVSAEALLEDYITRFHFHCVPVPHLMETVEHLKQHQFKLAVITNGFTGFQMRNIRALGIEHCFSEILVSEQVGRKKPDPGIFHHALDLLGVSPQESIYVGDHPINDVQASRQIGMIGVWKKSQHWSPPEHADFVIDDLAELKTLTQYMKIPDERRR